MIMIITSFFILDDMWLALSISAVDAIVATIYYYYFDRVWDSVIHPGILNIKLRIKYRKMK